MADDEGIPKIKTYMEDTPLLAKAIVSDGSTQDQSLVRPKVLILTPFKHMAYSIIEQIIMLCNEGKWKK